MSTSGDYAADPKMGLAARLIWGSIYCIVIALAVVGFFGLLLEIYSWSKGTRWHAEDINALLSSDSPFMHTLVGAWADFKYILQYGAYFIAGLALLLAVTQIRAISRLMSLYLEARGPIYQLAATMDSAELTAQRLAAQASRLSELEPTIKSMSEKVEEAVLKIGDLQRQAVSERVDVAADDRSAPAPQGSVTVETTQEDPNWEKLRELWNANGARLDVAIERIKDKRKRTKFSRMDRRNYPAIINGLADEGYISETARQGSLDLHAIFVGYRPRNREIPGRVIGDLEVLDRMLEQEFGCIPTAPVPAPVDNPALEPA
jgi:hypothetical protein